MRCSMGLFLKLISGLSLSLAAFVPAYAGPENQGPGASDWILNLAGSPILNHATQYTASFTAAAEYTDLSFDFRQDGDFLSFSSVSAIDTTAAKSGRTGTSENALLNGDFALGAIGTNSVDSWTYDNFGKVRYGGALFSGCGNLGANCWYDGAVQGYDSLSQTFSTVKGHVYEVSFWLNAGATSSRDFSNFSTNGLDGISGNGVNVAVFARAGIPVLAPPPAPSVPEASTWAMIAAGFAGLGLLGFLRSRKAHASA